MGGGDTPSPTPILYYKVSEGSGMFFICDDQGNVLQLERGIEFGEQHPQYAIILMHSDQSYSLLASKGKYDDLAGLDYVTIEGTYLTDQQVESGPEDVTDFYFIYNGHRFNVTNHVPDFSAVPFD